MSRDARNIIQKLLDLDPRRRHRACDLMREPWIKCNDLPCSIFETAGQLFRANSVDERGNRHHNALISQVHGTSTGGNAYGRSNSKADNFNRNIAHIHTNAMSELKKKGFSSKAIDESLKEGNNAMASGSIGGGISH